ncbi:MAG: OmpA family protein [Deltaproteobacteria bacterium]|nr:MAG: OmpA family protein [Deltaproteobacteria bacterium]
MKRILLIGVVAIFMVAVINLDTARSVPIAPGVNGGTGLLRTMSVRALVEGSFSVGFHGQYFYAKDLLFPEDLNAVNQCFHGSGAFTTGLTDWLELSFSSAYRQHSLEIEDYPERDLFVNSVGNLQTGLKFGYISDDGIGVGIDGFARFLGRTGEFGYQREAISGGGRILWTLDLTEARNVPLRIHMNIGYYRDNSIEILPSGLDSDIQEYPEQELALGIIRDDQVLGAIGIEVPSENLTFFVEYTTEQIVNADEGDTHEWFNEGGNSYSRNPQRVTPGFRLTPVKGLAIDLACDLSVTKKRQEVRTNPQWNAIAGISYSFLPGTAMVVAREEAPPAPITGKVSGKILDAQTLKPLGGAVIIMVGTGLTNLSADPVTAEYTTPELAPGEIEIGVSMEGYIPQNQKAMIEANDIQTLDFEMKKKAYRSAIKGVVTDPKNKPLAAVISFDDPTVSPGATNPINGSFEINIELPTPTKRYEVTAFAQGYKKEVKPLDVENGKAYRVNFILQSDKPPAKPAPPPLPIMPKKQRVILKKEKIEITESIHFKSGKATILPVSYSLLNEVAQILVDNASIKIRIDGHTDSVGSDDFNFRLSEARAASVMKYLISQGITPDRIDSKGFGESLPIADNSTEMGRAKNRRVEFTITGQ